MNLLGVGLYAGLGALIGGLAWVVASAQAGRHSRRAESRQSLARVGFVAVVAAYFGLVAARSDDAKQLVAIAVFTLPLLVILLVDWWTRFIYTNVIAVGIVAGLAVAALDGFSSLLHAVAGLAGGAGLFLAFFLLAAVIYRNLKVVPFGLGDVYLAGMIGAMVGGFLAAVGTLFYGILLAGVMAGLLLVTRKAGRRDPVPYGPYLCAGAFIALAMQVW
jgi:leader peptidase (prepilin peptidase)/N-methyltransferase